ncbi:MAG: hypothetical protein IKP28_04130 [Clostridia bacterium]|nr:hypothetical protein [Clostridia bacterium]
MEENAIGEADLNAKQKAQQTLEEATQELYDVRKKLQSLEMAPGFQPISISRYKGEVQLTDKLQDSDGIVAQDLIAIELENEEKERQTLLVQLKDDEIHLVATINEQNELILSEELKEKFGNYVREGELDEPYIVDREQLEKKKILEIPAEEREEEEREEEKSKEEREPSDDGNAPSGQKAKIAKALGVRESTILMVVEVKDEFTMSRVLNKNVEHDNLYLVKLKQDTGGIGSNDWVVVNLNDRGEYQRAVMTDHSDTIQDLNVALGNTIYTGEAADIDAGDIRVENYKGTNTGAIDIDVRREGNTVGKEHDEEMAVNKAGVAEPEEEEIEEEETLDEEEQEEELEEDDWTPGGEAYNRRFNRGH